MLCGELVKGGLASAGAVTVPCALLGLGLPGCLRPSTGSPSSPYLAILTELLAAAYLEEIKLAAAVAAADASILHMDYDDQIGGYGDNRFVVGEDLDVPEDVLLGEFSIFIPVWLHGE